MHACWQSMAAPPVSAITLSLAAGEIDPAVFADWLRSNTEATAL